MVNRLKASFISRQLFLLQFHGRLKPRNLQLCEFWGIRCGICEDSVFLAASVFT